MYSPSTPTKNLFDDFQIWYTPMTEKDLLARRLEDLTLTGALAFTPVNTSLLLNRPDTPLTNMIQLWFLSHIYGFFLLSFYSDISHITYAILLSTPRYISLHETKIRSRVKQKNLFQAILQETNKKHEKNQR